MKDCFVEKNNEAMPRSIVDLLSGIRRQLLPQRSSADTKNSKRNSCLITSLRKQLGILVDELSRNVCICHTYLYEIYKFTYLYILYYIIFSVFISSFQRTIFVRCVKPNNLAQPGQFDMHSVEVQLKCFGLAKYKSLMEQGFPNRLEFGQLLSMYDIRIIKEKHFHIALLLKSMGLDKHDYRIGHTRVCLRPLKPHDLDRILTPSEHDIVQVKNTYEKKLAIYGRWSFLVKAALANQSKIITAR